MYYPVPARIPAGTIVLAIILTLGLSLRSRGQEPVVDEIIEYLSSQSGTDADYSELKDHFDDLLRHPVNINRANAEELARLLLLNDFQINALLEYIRNTGPVLSIQELSLIYGFSPETVRQIIPYITLGSSRDDEPVPKVHPELIQRLSRRVEIPEGFVADSAGGAPEYGPNKFECLTRLNTGLGRHFDGGIILQHDPGEFFALNRKQYGPDYSGGYLRYRNQGSFLKAFILGKYHLEFGQGLVAWSGFSLSRSPAVLNITQKPSGIKPYRSAWESGGFQGVATKLQWGHFTLFPFLSHKRVDARIDSTETGTSPGVLSLPETGLHRTVTERSHRQNLGKRDAGFHLRLHAGNWEGGMTFLREWFDLPLIRGTEPYKLLRDSGYSFWRAGADYRFRSKKLLLTGEMARDQDGDWALVQNLEWYFSPVISLVATARKYDPGFYAPGANGFSTSGAPENENGLYLGFRLNPLPRMTLSGYLDTYRHPFATYHSNFPVNGSERLLILNADVSDNLTFTLRYSGRNEDRTYLPDGAAADETANEFLERLRIQGNYRNNDRYSFATRLEFSRYRFPSAPARGFLAYQQIGYRHPSGSVSGYFRYTLFGVSGYGARIYAYENDLLYAFSTPSFSGYGTRWFVLLRGSLSRRLNLSLKLSRTHYSDRRETGSGNDRIPAPHVTDIKVQLRATF